MVSLHFQAPACDWGGFRVYPYVREYHAYLRERECKNQPRPDYMDKVQTEVNQEHRATLIDWLFTFVREYDLMPSTLYQCIDLIDRSLSKFVVRKDE